MRNPSRIALARSASVLDSTDRFDVAVVPSFESWNDFGYRTRALFCTTSSSGQRVVLPGYFAIRGETDTAAFAKRLLLNSDYVSIDDLEKPFASLLFESKIYSLLRRSVGAEEAASLLWATHDASIFAADGSTVPGWPDLHASDVFCKSMTRASESYFAFRRGADIVRGVSLSGEDAQREIIAEVVSGFPAVKLAFSFDPTKALRGRMAVLVGNNGVGKTLTLAKLAAGLAGADAGIAFEKRPDVNQVLAFVHQSSRAIFQKKGKKKKSAAIRVFNLDAGRSGLFTAKDGFTDLLVDIVRSDDAETPALSQLLDVIRSELGDAMLCVPFRSDDGTSFSNNHFRTLEEFGRGTEQQRLEAVMGIDRGRPLFFLGPTLKARQLSVGQMAFVRFAMVVLAHIGPASVLVIDEPENFLHPNLISRFMRLVHSLLVSNRSIALIATHSPFVVREVQAANVHVLRPCPDGSVVVLKPRLQTLGASVSSVSDEVFGDDLPRHLFEDLILEQGVKGLDFEQVLSRFAGEISSEALMAIRRELEDADAQN